MDIPKIEGSSNIFDSSLFKDAESSINEDNGSFKDLLNSALNEVNKSQQEAEILAQDLALGRSDNIHETMLAISKADLSFRLVMQIRNKMVEAYQEVFRMQV